MTPIWKSKSSSEEKSLWDADSQTMTMPKGIIRLLQSRGFQEFKAAQSFLYPQLKSLQDPYLITGMKIAVDRLVQAFISSEKICIYADFDLDGTSGLALLKQGLEGLGFRNLIWYQPKRLSEGYGFHASAVEDLSKMGVQIIITVDVGITAPAACRKAKELGLDVILTDHHLPSGELPEAFIILNPNQKACDSKLTYLCGAGVAFYLLRALKRAFFENENLPKSDFDLRSVLDLFTIATLTDMVPLVSDNRVLVKQGLIELQKTKRPGLRALIDELGLSGQVLTSQDIGMKLAPKINALSRMETEVLPRDLYLAADLTQARSLVSQVMKNNTTRVQKQNEAESEALALLKNWDNPHFVFVVSPHFHRGVLGLVATKLVQIYNRPCFIGSLTESEGVVVGSARVPSGSEISLVEALSFASESLNRHGGHSAAAGFELFYKNVDQVQKQLSEYFVGLSLKPSQRIIEYDAEIDLEELNQNFMDWHDFLGPFGVGFPVPLFRLSSFKVVQLKELKGGHLKVEVESLGGQKLKDVLYFSPPAAMAKLFQDSSLLFDALVEFQWNYFLGRKSMQILLKVVTQKSEIVVEPTI